MTLTHAGLAIPPAVDQELPVRETAVLLARIRTLADSDDLTHASMAHPALTLEESFRICAEVTRLNSKSFFFSSQFLPPQKRRDIRAFYAFCRTSDDVVDRPSEDVALALARWITIVHTPGSVPNHPVLCAWRDVEQRYAVPTLLVDELLAGMAMDLAMHRYQTFEDLWLYCYRVASVVGLISMHIIGYQPGAESYAIKLGVALQLTNILRDVGEDARRGRIYLPQEDLARFGLTDADIFAGCRDERFQALMRFQIARADALYDASWPGIAMLNPDGQLAVAAASEVYRGILRRIERNQFDVFTRRAQVPLHSKLLILGNVWWRL